MCRPYAQIVLGSVVWLCTVATNVASGEDSHAGKAEELFRQGKQRLASEDFAAACPMFSESFALDPALGTLLALAMCHEGEGKLASALREYTGVVAHPDASARPDREQTARARISNLSDRVSRLTIAVPRAADVDGLEVRVDGAVIVPTHFGVNLGVDGGEHIVEASAKARETWRTHVTVAQNRDSETVTVPVLAASVRAEPNPPPAAVSMRPVQLSKPRAFTEPAGFSTLQWAGLGTMGAGLVGLGVGAFFTARAIGSNQDSQSGCFSDVCTPQAREERLDARMAGDAATAAFIAGGSLAVAGALMYVLAPPAAAERAPAQAALVAQPWACAHAFGTSVRGKF